MTDHDHDHDHTHEHEHEHEHSLDYAGAVAVERARKDAWFKSSPSSPIPHEVRHDFTGLPYFPVDPSLRFEDLRLEPYAGSEPAAFEIPTSDGQLKPATRAGTFSFELDGVTRRLTAYVVDGGDPESLFVPFLDETSGHETYGAGRYLDLEPDDDDTYALDFNLAYHPSCVYSPYYSCPLTPAENRLPVRIEAGERLAEDATGH
ncbi:MAG TPA: DUF1684 domain-containing protein [Candidatus Limnocylindrales bacterium]|jgi:hypothetical protein|nr:DUF1684 domain-containing protein [Candidatus Limnocylindrales bacterium]